MLPQLGKEAADEVASDVDRSSSGKQRAAKQGTTKHAYTAGQQVDAKYRAQSVGSFAANWYPGVVRTVHEDGTCDIDYADGDKEDKVPLKFIRAPRKLKAKTKVKAPTHLKRSTSSGLLSSQGFCSPVSKRSSSAPSARSSEGEGGGGSGGSGAESPGSPHA